MTFDEILLKMCVLPDNRCLSDKAIKVIAKKFMKKNKMQSLMEMDFNSGMKYKKLSAKETRRIMDKYPIGYNYDEK